MRKFWIVLLGLVTTLAQGCIFASGFDKGDCNVLVIGYGSYELLGPQMTANGPDAQFLSDPSYLVDGRPGTLVNAQWSSGTQTTASYVSVKVSPASHGGDTPDQVPVGVVALLNTDLPIGMRAQCLINGVSVANSTLEALSTIPGDTRTSVWFVFDDVSNYPVEVRLFNSDAAGTVIMDPLQVFTMGEFFAGKSASFPLKRDPELTYSQGNRIRYSSAGSQFPVQQPVIRQYTFDLAPLTQKRAFTDVDPINAQMLFRAIFGAGVVAFVPFPTFDPAYYGSQTVGKNIIPAIVSATAFIGQLAQMPTIKGNGDMYYDTSLQALESV